MEEPNSVKAAERSCTKLVASLKLYTMTYYLIPQQNHSEIVSTVIRKYSRANLTFYYYFHLVCVCVCVTCMHDPFKANVSPPVCFT